MKSLLLTNLLKYDCVIYYSLSICHQKLSLLSPSGLAVWALPKRFTVFLDENETPSDHACIYDVF